MKQRGVAVRVAVINATVRQVAALGPESVTIAAIAADADVHPTSIYRRWKTVDAVIIDALNEFTASGLTIPDTGSIRTDLLEFATHLQDWLATPLGLALSRTGVMPTNDEQVLASRKAFWRNRFDAAGEMIRRGIERGEIAQDIDADTVLAALVSPVRLAAISQHTEPPLNIEKIVDLVIGARS
ncbi:TetR-like C-terminal domain-containing protein [Rhodococcus sp. OK302]|uniref:TetR-like C-terminal domain-containing protein n=1 Tax=Rhodococcus sp. OK302 TaxID=1882769 RepID=UPI000B94114E|nr:TetR-like C-terminal domain-containing protein [Rhodococcus sp. OK302]OYD61302.1 TetR family transcriptional regulator [Rhodococcus sp. OK302]